MWGDSPFLLCIFTNHCVCLMSKSYENLLVSVILLVFGTKYAKILSYRYSNYFSILIVYANNLAIF